MSKKVLFVCLGNICRSPLAEAIFKHKIAKLGLQEHFYADSCGTGDYHIGLPPDTRTIANATKNGVKIEHRARQLSAPDFEKFDHILVMDENNRKNSLRVADPAHHAKVRLLRTFETQPASLEVPDPYYGTERDFQQVFEILDRAVDGLIASLTADA